MSEDQQASKRCRVEDEDTYFPPLLEWVRSNGGWFHSAITSKHRELVVNETIDEGTVLCRLPWKTLVTVSRIETIDERCIQIMEQVDSSLLYHSVQDCTVAIFLAGKPAEFEAYLGSLPDSSAFDTLPRRWKKEQLDLLKGSPLLRRIEKVREGIQKDYSLIRQAAQDNGVPSFDDFSDAMAAVSSRAFEGMKGFEELGGREGDTTIIPLLDLCNHRRGALKKNIGYTFDQGAVVVKAANTVDKGETLRITYGAQGNAQLLLNYGFCLPNNIEPDGSSNDVFELYPRADSKDSIFLRTGPKSYTYGCFVEALEEFFESNGDDAKKGVGSVDPEDDMEAFLNECEEGGEEDGGIDWMVDADEAEEEEEKGEEERQKDTINAELAALASFRRRLEELKSSYTLSKEDLERAALPVSSEASHEYFAALLVQSEQRTIYFYIKAIDCVETELGNTTTSTSDLKVVLDSRDMSLIQRQTSELSSAYMLIRHPVR